MFWFCVNYCFTDTDSKPRVAHLPRGWMAVGINSRKCWQSGCMQGSIRMMDSKRTYFARFLWHEGSPRVTDYDPQYYAYVYEFKQKHKISPAPRGSCARLETSIKIPQTHEETRKERWKENVRPRRPQTQHDDWSPNVYHGSTLESVPGTVLAPADEEQFSRDLPKMTLMSSAYRKQEHAQKSHENIGGTPERRGGVHISHMGLPERIDTILNWTEVTQCLFLEMRNMHIKKHTKKQRKAHKSVFHYFIVFGGESWLNEEL